MKKKKKIEHLIYGDHNYGARRAPRPVMAANLCTTFFRPCHACFSCFSLDSTTGNSGDRSHNPKK